MAQRCVHSLSCRHAPVHPGCPLSSSRSFITRLEAHAPFLAVRGLCAPGSFASGAHNLEPPAHRKLSVAAGFGITCALALQALLIGAAAASNGTPRTRSRRSSTPEPQESDEDLPPMAPLGGSSHQFEQPSPTIGARPSKPTAFTGPTAPPSPATRSRANLAWANALTTVDWIDHRVTPSPTMGGRRGRELLAIHTGTGLVHVSLKPPLSEIVSQLDVAASTVDLATLSGGDPGLIAWQMFSNNAFSMDRPSLAQLYPRVRYHQLIRLFVRTQHSCMLCLPACLHA